MQERKRAKENTGSEKSAVMNQKAPVPRDRKLADHLPPRRVTTLIDKIGWLRQLQDKKHSVIKLITV